MKRRANLIRTDAIFAVLAALTLVIGIIILSAGRTDNVEEHPEVITKSATLLAGGDVEKAQDILNELPANRCADLTLYDVGNKQEEYVIKEQCLDPQYTNASIELARQSVSHQGKVYLVEVRVWDIQN